MNETDTLSQKVADEVIKGEWGNGEARKKLLTEYGYDWRHIQNLVNEKLGNPVRHIRLHDFKLFKGGMNNDKK